MQNGADFSKYREICSIVCVYSPRFLHPHHPTPLFMGRDKGGYKVNYCKEGTENGASQRAKRLCKNSHQSMAQKRAAKQRRTTQHKHSATSVQRNQSTARIAPSRRSAATRRVFYLRKVSSMFSISSRNVASVANWRSIFLQLCKIVE